MEPLRPLEALGDERGADDAGELRQRCERLHAFPDLASVESALADLQNDPDGALITCLPAGHGRRVAAYAHLFCGPVDPSTPTQIQPPPTTAVRAPSLDDDWKLRIESELAALRSELADLKAQLGV